MQVGLDFGAEDCDSGIWPLDDGHSRSHLHFVTQKLSGFPVKLSLFCVPIMLFYASWGEEVS